MALRAAACAVVAALGLAACSSPEQRVERHVARAERHEAAGRLRDALLELENALKADPEHADVNQRMGELFAEVGEPERAAFHLSEALRIDPDRLDAALRLAELLRHVDPMRAERIVLWAKRRHPDDPRVHRSESAFALAHGNAKRALAAALEAARIGPGNAESWMRLGMAQRSLARGAVREGASPEPALAAALDAFEKTTALAPDHPDALLQIARVHAAWPGHETEAVAAFRAALAQAERREDPMQRLAAALGLERFARARGDDALLREALRHQVAVAPGAVATWQDLADASERLEGADAARAVFGAMRRAAPDSPDAVLAHAAYEARRAGPDAAVALLERALRDGREEPEVLARLLRLHVQRGRLDDARRVAGELAERHADAPRTANALARLALAEGRPEEAITRLGEPHDDDDAEREALRARAALKLGRVEAAKAALDRARRRRPNASALRIEAAVHARAGEWPQALDTIEAMRERGVDPSARERLIEIEALYASGDAATARAKLAALLAAQDAPPEAALTFARHEGEREPEAATRHLAAAHRRAPRHGEVLRALTHLDVLAGRTEAALARLDASLEADPSQPRTRLLRAETLARAGRLERAEADALRAFAAAPGLPGAVDLIYDLHRRRGRLDDARRALEERAAREALHVGERMLLARLRVAHGDVARAQEALEAVVAERPDLARAKNDLAFLLAWRGRELERAERLADEALAALPGNPHVEDTAGYVALRLGRTGRALSHFGRAIVGADPDSASLPTYYFHRGLALARLGRSAEADDAFERALELDPELAAAARD